MSRSTVRTIMEAPADRRTITLDSWPCPAAKCKAVTPFSALLSMYLIKKAYMIACRRQREWLILAVDNLSCCSVY